MNDETKEDTLYGVIVTYFSTGTTQMPRTRIYPECRLELGANIHATGVSATVLDSNNDLVAYYPAGCYHHVEVLELEPIDEEEED